MDQKLQISNDCLVCVLFPFKAEECIHEFAHVRLDRGRASTQNLEPFPMLFGRLAKRPDKVVVQRIITL